MRSVVRSLLSASCVIGVLMCAGVAAADRIFWPGQRDPAIVDGFVDTWRKQTGAPPQLQEDPTDTIAEIATYPTNYPNSKRAHPTALPVVWLAVPRHAEAPATGETGIYAEPSPAAMLALWQQLLPTRQPAGVMVSATGRPLWSQWRLQARQRGLALQPGFVRPGESPQRVYTLLRPRLGLLLYSANLASDDPVAISVMLRESLASGLPVLATDRRLLPAGAYASLDQPASETGAQAARLALALRRGNPAGWQEPDGLQIQLNHQVARTLQLPLAAIPDADATPDVVKPDDAIPNDDSSADISRKDRKPTP